MAELYRLRFAALAPKVSRVKPARQDTHLSITVKLAAIHVLLVASLLAVIAVAWRHLPDSGGAAGVDQLARAQRATQNADMLHDALHADVLSALLATRDLATSHDDVRQALRENAQGFRAEFATLASMNLDAALGPDLDRWRPGSAWR